MYFFGKLTQIPAMHIHYFQHVPFEGLGCIQSWIDENKHTVSHTRWYETISIPNLDAIDMLIIMGGPMGVYEETRYPWMHVEKKLVKLAIDSGKIVLGICFGAQLIAAALGANVFPNQQKEIGWHPVYFKENVHTFRQLDFLPSELRVLHWHGDTFDLPDESLQFASSVACNNQAFIYKQKVLGLQFHFEILEQGVQDLLTHCENELITAPFIQDKIHLLKGVEHIPKANAYMYKLLDRLTAMAG